jgi:hypothetical protein
MDAKDISARTSTLRISSQNELFLQAHIWDTVAETAHSGLNDVRADLSGLTRWIELVSKLDLPFEQRREALWRTLIEDVTAKSPGTSWPHRLDHDDFKGWLIFVCISAALGHGENFQSNHRSTERYDRYYHEKTGRPQPLIERLLRQAKACFVALGIPCSAEDNRSLEIWKCILALILSTMASATWQAVAQCLMCIMLVGTMCRDECLGPKGRICWVPSRN